MEFYASDPEAVGADPCACLPVPCKQDGYRPPEQLEEKAAARHCPSRVVGSTEPMKIVSTAPPEILWDRIQHDVHHVAPTILTRGGRGPIWSVRFEGMAFAIAHHASILEARGTVEPTSTGGSILSFHIVPSPSWGPLIYIVPVFILGALRAITMAAGLAAILIASESMSAIGYWRHIHHWVREAEGPHPYPTILAREKSPYTADPDRTLRPGPTLLGMVLILVLGLMIAWAFGVMAES